KSNEEKKYKLVTNPFFHYKPPSNKCNSSSDASMESIKLPTPLMLNKHSPCCNCGTCSNSLSVSCPSKTVRNVSRELESCCITNLYWVSSNNVRILVTVSVSEWSGTKSRMD